MKLILRFLIATLTAIVAASIAHSQFVLIGLVDIGVSIPASDWISMTLSDIWGLLPGYGSVIGVALLLSFLIIAGVQKWLFTLPDWRFSVAGFIGIAAALIAMQPLLDVTLIAGARTEAGFFFQCVAGAIGGYVFGLLNRTSTDN